MSIAKKKNNNKNIIIVQGMQSGTQRENMCTTVNPQIYSHTLVENVSLV